MDDLLRTELLDEAPHKGPITHIAEPEVQGAERGGVQDLPEDGIIRLEITQNERGALFKQSSGDPGAEKTLAAGDQVLGRHQR